MVVHATLPAPKGGRNQNLLKLQLSKSVIFASSSPSLGPFPNRWMLQREIAKIKGGSGFTRLAGELLGHARSRLQKLGKDPAQNSQKVNSLRAGHRGSGQPTDNEERLCPGYTWP